MITARAGTRPIRSDAPLLERDAEYAVLDAAVTRLLDGEGSLVYVRAAAGLGKSRLLDAATERAERAGIRVMRAAGNELEHQFSFGVVLQLFEPCLPSRAHERDELFAGAAGLARGLLEQGSPGGAGEGDDLPLLHGLYWLASNLAEHSALMLAVDDLHWADRASIRFLAYLARRLEGLPIVLVLASRPHEPESPQELLGVLAEVAERSVLTPMPLSEEAVDRVVRARLPAAASEFVQASSELTGGNPFLLEELLRGVEVLGEPPDVRTAARLGELASESVLRSVDARIARLPEGSLDLVRSVALLGPNAELRTAASLISLAPATARRAADALAEAEVLRTGRPLRFVHPLLRQVIYESMPATQTAAAHGRAARLIAADGAPLDAVAAHLLLAEVAGDPWAVSVLERAAVRAVDDGAPSAAVSYLRRALAEPPPPERRPRTLHALGRAEAAAGEPTAVERLTAALEALEAPADRAAAAQDLARALHIKGAYLEAAEVLDQTMADLGPSEPLLARELEATWVGIARLALPLREKAIERLTVIAERPRAETYAERLLLAQASGQKTFAGDPREEGIALARAALASGELLFEGGPDDQGWLIALATFAWADDFDTAERGIQACLDDARRRGQVRRFANATYGMTMTRYYAGHIGESVADNERAIELRHTGWHEYLPAACAQLAWAYIDLDDLDAAERALALPELDHIQNAGQTMAIDARGRLCAARGDAESALEEAMAGGRALVRAHVLNPSCLSWRSTAALAAVKLGKPEQARGLAEEELHLARRFGAPRPIGVALRTCGLVEGGDDGVELLREAVDSLERSPAGLEYARALIDLGATLRRAGHRVDARGPLRAGLGMAEGFGARALERRAREELIVAGARPRRREISGLLALTPSERRVVEMANQGMTNREIAQALFVTTKAVQWHLGNSYRKLGISGRDGLSEVLDAARTTES